MNPVTPVFLSRSTRMLRPHKALRMLEEGNNALVKRVNEHVCNTLSSKEAIDTVFNKTGIRLSFADPFGHVEEA